MFGNCVECSVKLLTLGLLAREKTVAVVADACGYRNEGSAELALRQIAAKGARIITVDELRLRKLRRHHRYSTDRAEERSSNGRSRNTSGRSNDSGRRGRFNSPLQGTRLGGRVDKSGDKRTV